MLEANLQYVHNWDVEELLVARELEHAAAISEIVQRQILGGGAANHNDNPVSPSDATHQQIISDYNIKTMALTCSSRKGIGIYTQLILNRGKLLTADVWSFLTDLMMMPYSVYSGPLVFQDDLLIAMG